MQIDLSKMSDREFHESFQRAVRDEKQATLLVLDHIRETNCRKLYAKMGYPTLWAYLVHELKYDTGSAQRRILAARISESIPEVRQAIADGALTVTSCAIVQGFIQKERQISGKNYSNNQKRELINSVCGKSTRETERILQKISPAAIVQQKARAVGSHHTEMNFILDNEDVKNLERLQELFSSADPSITQSEILKKALQLAVTAAEKKKFSQKTPARESHLKQNPNRRAPGKVLRTKLFENAAHRCTYRSPITGKRCEAKIGLQTEHCLPHALGGPTTASNMTVLCKTHNALRADEVFARSP